MPQCNYFGCKSDSLPELTLCQPHTDRRREYERLYRERHKQRIYENKRQYRDEHAVLIRTQKARRRHEVKLQVINAYGGACVCCNETYLPFLQLDHINGDGKNHRQQAGTGQGILYDLIKRGYPPIVQVLCANCHLAKTLGFPCLPHLSDDDTLQE